jgi:hypothetical protein
MNLLKGRADMKNKNIIKKIKNFTVGALVLVYAVMLIYFSKEVSDAAVKAIAVCIRTIIPSLFAFMVISEFIVTSGLYSVISKPFSFAAKHIFHIKPELFSIFLISSVAGYPVGAKMLTKLYTEELTDEKTASEMLGICYMGGPAFFCGTAGIAVYSDVKIGLMLFLCVFLANLTVALLSGLKREVPATNGNGSTPALHFSLTDFVGSINSGGAALLKICAAIIFFSTFTAIADRTGIIAAVSSVLSGISGLSESDCTAILKSILEISNITYLSSDIRLMPVIAALLSFGGLCVILQTEGIIESKISTNNFYLCRIIAMILSYLYCKILIHMMNITEIVQTSTQTAEAFSQNSPIPSLFLLIMTILLLSKNFIAKSEKM